MSQYTESDLLRSLRRQLAEHAAKAPGEYDSRWQESLDSLVQQILEQEDFAYDPMTDPLFQRYQDRAVNLGRRSMMDTLGQTAALTGGYGNSYAQQAAQQAYDSQLQGLYDRLPELYNLALDRYRLGSDALYGRYDLLSGLEKDSYSRYQAGLNRWEGERDYLTGRVDAERDFDYGAHRDQVSDEQWQREFDEQLRQFNFKNKLGEFAPQSVPVSSSGSGGSSPAAKPMTKPEKKRSQLNKTLRNNQKKGETV